MFAIIETGGKQYRVQQGDVIRVEKIDHSKGDVVEFADVLAVGGDEDVSWGAPTLPGVTVTAKVLDQGRGPKIVVFRYRAKSNHRRRKGHRQPFTAVEIQSINR
jgi:large subunit ribosomal protein L21